VVQVVIVHLDTKNATRTCGLKPRMDKPKGDRKPPRAIAA
jgi:hypothetical protein